MLILNFIQVFVYISIAAWCYASAAYAAVPCGIHLSVYLSVTFAVAAPDCHSWGKGGGQRFLKGGQGIWGPAVPQRGPGAEPRSWVWGTKSPREAEAFCLNRYTRSSAIADKPRDAVLWSCWSIAGRFVRKRRQEVNNTSSELLFRFWYYHLAAILQLNSTLQL